MIKIVLALLLFIPSFAAAATELIWDAPTTFEDGTPAPAEAVTGYHVYRGDHQNALSRLADVPGTQTRLPLDPAHRGDWFAVSASSHGGEGAQSKPIRWLAPGAPGNPRIRVTIDLP